MSLVSRSTKGASKQRRDMINGEILNLRDLLPLPEAARQRLSQLQIMSLCSVYIRKCNYFSKCKCYYNCDFNDEINVMRLIITIISISTVELTHQMKLKVYSSQI